MPSAGAWARGKMKKFFPKKIANKFFLMLLYCCCFFFIVVNLSFQSGQRIAEETIRQHLKANNGEYPETVAVTLWGKFYVYDENIIVVFVLFQMNDLIRYLFSTEQTL